MTIFAGHDAGSASIPPDPDTEVVMRGAMWCAVSVVVAVVVAVGCGTEPGAVDVAEPVDVAAEPPPVVVYMPDDVEKPLGMEALPLVEVHGRVGLGQCNPCVTDAGHGCCGTDGWTAPVACGNAQGYVMDCRQVPTGCGQTLVAGVRVCE